MSKLQIGEPAPNFELTNLEGMVVKLVDFRGQSVLINFWSAECPWAERTDQALKDWLALGNTLEVLLVASNGSEPVDMLRQAALERGWRQVLLDPDHQVADLYGAETTPHCFLLDEQGMLRYQGAFDDVTFRQRTPTRFYVFEAAEALKQGKAVLMTKAQPYGCSIVRFRE